jgi:iron uptake system EfeUOB component EfeO/EfeM
MNKDEAIEAIENILYSDLNLSEGTKKALTYTIDVLKRIDNDKIFEVTLTPQKSVIGTYELTDEIFANNLSQAVVSYLEGK